jgi:protein-S-isoprenylcysteine O-methyltransferase Ste14
MQFWNRSLGVTSALLGIVCLVEAHSLWTGWDGAGTMPIIVGTLFIILSVFFIFLPSREEEAIEFYSKKELFPIGIIIISLGVYLVAVDWLGYSFSTWLLLAVINRSISSSKIPTTLVWTGSVAFGTNYIFRNLLSVALPTGFVGF